MNLPVDFVKKYRDLLREDADIFFDSFQKNSYKGIRFNPLKVNQKTKDEICAKYNLSPVPWCDEGYYFDSCQPGKDNFHQAGAFYIQEPSAMVVGEAVNIRPGMKVLDLCAAPGGKSSHIAGKLLGNGLLWSNEYISKRAEILSSNIERMGIGNCIVSSEEPKCLADKLGAIFDIVFVDSPCSGEGMFRKSEEAVKEWSLENVTLCSERSKYILKEADRLLKEGGKLVYSTCTFSPEENEKVIADFLDKNNNYKLMDLFCYRSEWKEYGFKPGNPDWVSEYESGSEITKTVRLWQDTVKGEGHYVAVLCKDEGRSGSYAEPNKKNNKLNMCYKMNKNRKNAIDIFEVFCSEVLEKKYYISTFDIERIITIGPVLYLIPENTPDLSNINVLRYGLKLGIIKKDRFEPSHSFGMALKPENVKRCINLCDENEAFKYLKGESLIFPTDIPGWSLISYKDISMGFCKITGTTVKNHYPKGLRIQC